MKIVLLSGGSGKRLWPLYGETRSRQFLKVLNNGDTKESAVMRVVRQLEGLFPREDIFITATGSQKDIIRRQLNMEDRLIEEPLRRGTYPAVLLSGAYILENFDSDPSEIIIIVPVDPYTDEDYFKGAAGLSAALSDSGANLGLMGIKPTYPSEKYGYIQGEMIPGKSYGRVISYVEKPKLSKAQELFKSNGRWNGGVFAIKAGFLKELLHKELGDIGGKAFFDAVTRAYDTLPAISFDREILEIHEDMIYIPYDGEWRDLGTWNTLTEKMEDPDGGLVLRGENCKNTHVINELGIPVVALGLKDTVVVASADGILVSDKHSTSFMEPYVEQIDSRPMYEKRNWGEYRVLDLCKCTNGRESSLTKRLYIEPGCSLSYQRHHLRDEIWTIIDGSGYFVLDGERKEVKRGEVLYIKKGQWHSLYGKSGIEFIEVQLGTELVEEDIERTDYNWDLT